MATDESMAILRGPLTRVVRALVQGAMRSAPLTLLASCSLFVPGTQQVTIETSDPTAEIRANGELVGTGRAVAALRRNRTCTVVARTADGEARTVLETRISPTGVLDIVGGLLFYLPYVGLFAPGAFELESSSVTLTLEPRTPR